MPPGGASTGELLATIKIKLDGAELDPAIYRDLAEAKVTDSLHVPDVAQVKFNDPALAHADDTKLTVGARLEILMSGPAHGKDKGGQGLNTVFLGVVTSIELVLEAKTKSLVIRAFDDSHKLFQGKKNRVFSGMSVVDIARRIFSDNNLEIGKIDNVGGSVEFVQQSNESDWDFLSRLGRRYDMEIVMNDGKANFRKASGQRATAPALEYGSNLVSFVARVTGAQSASEVVVTAHDSKSGQQMKGEATIPDGAAGRLGMRASSITKQAAGRKVKLTVAGGTQAELDAAAKAAAARYSRTNVEANGTAHGNSLLKAGSEVEVEGVGKRFSGQYILSQTTHVYRSKSGYTTQFSISGAPRTLSALLGGSSNGSSSGGGGGFEGLTVGIVTNSNDNNGRVKVRYPSLSGVEGTGVDVESGWARVVMPGARKGAGFGMIPMPGDEVVVGFEHGDMRRPYVLGSVWSGKQKAGKKFLDGKPLLDNKEGSIQAYTPGGYRVQANQDMKLMSSKDMVLESKAAYTTKVASKMEAKAGSDYTIEAGANVTIKAGAQMTIKASAPLKIEAPQIEIKASGQLKLGGAQVMIG